MRLRESQRKFKSHMVESTSIEVARAFDYPNNVYLNKYDPLYAPVKSRLTQ